MPSPVSPLGGPLCGPRPRKFPASAQQKVGVGVRHAGKWSGARSSPDPTRPLSRVAWSRGRRGHVATRSEQPRAGSGARGETRVSQHRARFIILEHYYRFGFCDLNGNKSRVNLDNVSFLNGVLSMYKLRIHACICYLNIFLNLQLWVFDTPHLRGECGREVKKAAEQENKNKSGSRTREQEQER